MSRDKENRSIQDKLKQIFKINRANPGNIAPNKEFKLTNDILRDLGKDSPTNTRLRTMRELTDHVLSTRLEMNGVEKLWSCVQDMFMPEYLLEERHATFAFLKAVIKGQFDRIDVMRAQFFRFIKHHDNPQDLGQKVELLAVLTNNGKDVEHFEEEIGPFLLNWLVNMAQAEKLQELLVIIDNVIKFNSTHLDEYLMTGYVRHICTICCDSTQYNIVLLCLQILGTVVAYSILPTKSISQFVGTLCCTVNVRCYTGASWKTMRNLLGTHLGHSSLFIMCDFLQQDTLRNDTMLLRGSVFYIHMALWEINSLPNLLCPPSSVLPSFLKAAQYNHPNVAHEVVLGIQKLINKHGSELIEPTWDILLEIIDHIMKQIDLAPNEVPNNLMIVPLHEMLNTIEYLIEVGNYKGSLKKFFHVIHERALERPENSVLKLVIYHAERIMPSETGWMQSLFNLLTDYFKPTMKTNIRLKVLSVLSDTITIYGEYDDELIDRIVIPHTLHIALDDNIVIRSEVAKLLLGLCMDYNSPICMDMLDILEKLLMRPFERFLPENPPTNEAEFFDIHILVPGLVQVFAKKIHRLPSSHAVKVHKMLVAFLNKHFEVPIFKNFNQSRIKILESFLNLRADSLCRLGIYDPSTKKTKYSSYLCVTYKNMENMAGSPPPTSPTLTQPPNFKMSYLNMEGAFKVILTFVEKEKDWEVLKMLLEKLGIMLTNKAIILSKQGNSDLPTLLKLLSDLVIGKFLPESAGVKATRAEFLTALVSTLVTLSSYYTTMDLAHQQLLINTLTRSTGIDPRCSRQSINALTVCMVDMRDTMMKLLPEVLLRLSKISASKFIAMPILEFLSTLSQLPTVYSNFVGDQYMAVFAIALPYTNPFKYDNYVVSLAYHVISVWFLKCRLPFRRDFVKFIVSGLQTNVIIPFKELDLKLKVNYSNMNQDSSDRKRSSSLTEQGSRRRNADGSQMGKFNPQVRDKTLLTFYEELNETCIDLMARYTFSPCSALPNRFPTADFLLKGGLTKSWMLGNKLITITTSGCTEKVLRDGVCDKCWSMCSLEGEERFEKFGRSNSGGDERDGSFRRQSSSDKSSTDESNRRAEPDNLPKLIAEGKNEPPLCVCWCQGWAEILIRRPTGNISWVMRIQNQVSFRQLMLDFPLNEMATCFFPKLSREPSSIVDPKQESEANTISASGMSAPGSPTRQSLSRQSSRESADEEPEIEYDDGTRSRNPVRRSNSSPEMANWKNPFIHQKVEKEPYDLDMPDEDVVKKNKKDMRVSCAAIPEEILGTGTSPPTGEGALSKTEGHSQHPGLLTCHSYPGSSPPKDHPQKPYKTVPPSPNPLQPSSQPSFPSRSESLEGGASSDKGLERPNNLPNLSNLSPLSSKPPQSPTQTSPRLSRHLSEKNKDGLPIQKSSSASVLEKSRAKSLGQAEPTLSEKRDRLHTISVMSTSTRKSDQKKVPKEMQKSGINPSFVFLQLYHAYSFGSSNEVPLYVHPTVVIERAISILDRMYPYEVHKIGVLFINPGQVDKEAEILRNTYGCLRYMQFLEKLGTLIRLADVNPRNVFLGGVDQNGSNGKYLYTHQDNLVMLAFHVATLMPNKENDPQGNYKKAHVGNDNVVIVYNNSGDEFDISTFKSQVTLAYIIVEPLDFDSSRVDIKVKPELQAIMGLRQSMVVSDQSVSTLVRQLAIHADLAATVLNSLRSHANDPYASNWLERLRKLKNLREKVIQEIKKRKDEERGFSDAKDAVEDFTDFT